MAPVMATCTFRKVSTVGCLLMIIGAFAFIAFFLLAREVAGTFLPPEQVNDAAMASTFGGIILIVIVFLFFNI